MLAALRPLLPRLYSISSSQLEHPRRVQVTVAVVRYRSLSRERIGVTSTYLAERLQVCPRCLYHPVRQRWIQQAVVRTSAVLEQGMQAYRGHVEKPFFGVSVVSPALMSILSLVG